jgi:uncharacterized iron-regulated protein
MSPAKPPLDGQSRDPDLAYFQIPMIPPGFAHVGRTAALLLAITCTACTLTAPREVPREAWENRLQDDAVVMLGEVHDNAMQHRLRLEILRRAFAAGWRPAILMEQFDREHQAEIDRARRERPTDAQHVIDLAALSNGGSASGWNWDLYRPFVALALQYDVPLIAANLSRSDAGKVVRDGYTAVFDEVSLVKLGLDQPIAREWQAAQQREIDAGHCHSLPASLLPAMARAQFARDAVMADVLREHASRGVVLLAGDGHVRRDLGVPRWLGGAVHSRVFTVGFLEEHNAQLAASFDVVVYTARAARAPPCAEFQKRPMG